MAGFPTDHLEGINDDRKEFRVVGKPHLPGRLSWAMATGVAKYGGDYAVDDMLHAKFLRSPYANARIKSIDTAKAMKIPGVVEIITWEDEEVRSFITNSADQEGMEIGAVVVAENEDICEEALKQLNVEWEVLPHVVDLREGRKPDAPVIRAIPPPAKAGGGMGMGGGANPPKQGNVSFSNVSEGDVEAGFKEADHIIEIDVNTSSFAGHIPDPLGSVAWWFDSPYHGEGKNLRIEGVPWGHGQVPRTARIPQEKVFQECMLMGGRYCDWGTRGSQLITPMLSRRTGKPVRCVINRSQMYDFNLNERYVRLKVGYKSNGLITAIDDFTIADGGVQGSSNFGNTMDQTFGPYFTTRCLNVRQRMEVVDSNRGKMWVSGQHNPMNWDSLTVALYTIA
ncbi:MAG TPA: molybdopterin cofactor-binding domain-containing protein, partial [Acidobacteriota bacterium]|nr:molybdopterin cofactor-binding domain-containing protein [Acidobacteriota bacterium]